LLIFFLPSAAISLAVGTIIIIFLRASGIVAATAGVIATAGIIVPGTVVFVPGVVVIVVGAVFIVVVGAAAIVVGLLLKVVEYAIGPCIEWAPMRGAYSSEMTIRIVTLVRKYHYNDYTMALANTSRIFFAITIITTLAAQTLLITITELTIAHNQHLIQSKEGDWTFGQTLALMLTLIPLAEAIKFLWAKRPRAPRGSGKGREGGRERREDRKAELGAGTSV
jgi:hypothetical protein